MNEKNDLTTGSIFGTLVKFSLPFMLAAFMQTFYGLADLFVVGLFNDPSTTTAVSIGSQVMHMFTVITLGLAMGTTVQVGQSIGAKDYKKAGKVVGNSILIFASFAIVTMVLLLIFTKGIVSVMLTPTESVGQTITYMIICFAGIPFIVAYNVISSILRGVGDSKRPMYYVAIACVTNVVLDFVFVGAFGLGAAGAALATIFGQAVSVVISLFAIRKMNLGFSISLKDIKYDKFISGKILGVGTPIALQDGFIQIAFIVITVIANSRGLIDSAGVGIVEKIICFLFLVPSSMLSAISAITAQNIGAGKPERARKNLYYGLMVTIIWGIFCGVYNQFLPHTLVGLFSKDAMVVAAGCAYIRAYACDTLFAGVHFCFSGYFCGIERSGISFIHNLISVIFIRIPGSYYASKMWPDDLYPMGWAAPVGSLLSIFICIGFYIYIRRKEEISK